MTLQPANATTPEVGVVGFAVHVRLAPLGVVRARVTESSAEMTVLPPASRTVTAGWAANATWLTVLALGSLPVLNVLATRFSRRLHPAVSIETVQTLLAEQEALRIRLADREQSFSTLHEQHELLCRQAESWDSAGREVTPRSETTYLNIVGGLLALLLGKSPGGRPYSSFETMDSVISALLAHYEGRPGISERTLWAKFSAARRHLDASDR